MTVVARAPRRRQPASAELDRRFEAIVFDWDGTAVTDRAADATELREAVEELSAAGVDLVVVSGTNLGNVDGQLRARPKGPGRLRLCLNRGSEYFGVGPDGPCLLWRREATPDEESLLDAAADLTVRRLRERGLLTEIVARRLNRRKVDLIPLPAWSDPPKARIAELLEAVEGRLRAAGIGSLAEAVGIAQAACTDAGLPGARVTSDAKHLEIGLTDKADALRWAMGDLWRQGIGPGLVLLAGDEFGPIGGLPGSDALMLIPEASRATALSVGVEPGGVPGGVTSLVGGPPRFAEVLRDQLRRRLDRDLPEIDRDPGWSVTVIGVDRESERAAESLMTLADGRTGTAGAPLDEDPATSPRVLLAGVYTGDGPGSELLAAPLWDRSGRSSPDQGRLERVLDLHTGTLFERSTDADGGALRASLRFSSLPRPGVVALRSAGAAQRLPIGPPLVPVADAPAVTSGSTTDGVAWAVAGSESGGCAAASREWRSDHGAAAPPEAVARVERLAGYAGDGVSLPETAPAIERLAEAETLGFDRLLSEQRAAWAERWAAAGIDIEGDPELERAVRVALYHLIGSAASSGEAAVGARGLSGTAYRGHVFWDADVFVLPFLAATHPAAARAMLEYRLQRLPAARQAAALAGRKGARFPWESARTGDDVTPPFIRDLAGRGMTIGTGLMEEHVVADVAWAAQTYLDWTADRAFAAGPGAALLSETARYWASRIELDRDGRAHIYGVIGPDEYHEPVDDDAFTNVMARWNLRRGARQPGVSPRETATWRRLADALVDGYDPRTRIYEQCAGFHELEPLVISRTAPRRPVAADLLLGRERVRQAQIVKQPDVLMLHQMLPDAVHRGSLVPNLDYYEPRTAHGSSLSPGIHASLFARVGRDDEALEALRLTARLDLDDVTRTTAGGVHLAAMGSVWQALVHGFAGVRPHPRHLALDPRLPSAWSALEIPLQHAGRHLRIRIERDVLTLTTDNPLVIRLADGPMRRVAAGQTRYRRRRDDWEEETR